MARIRLPETPAGTDESFAELFEESIKGGTGKGAPGRNAVKIGERVTGTIVSIGSESIFVDVGAKGEASLSVEEVRDQDTGEIRVHVGDSIEAQVISVGADGIVLARSLGRSNQSLEALEQAVESGIPVEGTVSAVNKGGLEVQIGGLRAFCPMSQVDVRQVENPQALVGQKFQFRISRFENRGRNIVVSRRALLEEERQVKLEGLREKLVPGAILTGTVSSLRDFGAFVDLGGLEGLLHISEISFGRLGHPKEALELGKEVTVQVLKIEPGDKGKERVSLSIKALAQDPWIAEALNLRVGTKVSGKVVRLQPFGAFVEVMPGIDGLIHISELSAERVNHPGEVVAEGQVVEATVVAIDLAKKRIGLSLTAPTSEEAEGKRAEEQRIRAALRPGLVVEATVDRIESYGIFARFTGEGGLSGRGLIPNVELGTPRGTDNKRVFAIGSKMRALILEIDDTGRIRLSKKGAEEADERAEFAEYLGDKGDSGASQGPKSGLGTMAALFNKGGKPGKK